MTNLAENLAQSAAKLPTRPALRLGAVTLDDLPKGGTGKILQRAIDKPIGAVS